MAVVIQLTLWTIFLFSQCSITAETHYTVLRFLIYFGHLVMISIKFFALDSAHKALGPLFATLLTIFFLFDSYFLLLSDFSYCFWMLADTYFALNSTHKALGSLFAMPFDHLILIFLHLSDFLLLQDTCRYLL